MPLFLAYEGKRPKVDPSAFIAENAVLIGDVTIEKNASIWYNCVLRGDVAPIVVGEDSNVQDGSVIHVASEAMNGEAFPTTIGKRVTVGHMALLHACTIEDECLVGMKSCVMDRAQMEAGLHVSCGRLTPSQKDGAQWTTLGGESS